MTQLDDTPDVLAHDARLRDVEARVARLTADLADLAAALTAPGDPVSPPTGPPAERPDGQPGGQPGGQSDATDDPEPVYASLGDWVEQYFAVAFARSVGGETRWCPRWPEHPEAVIRLEALWRSWEALRLDPSLGIATWLTGYLDPQLTILLGRTGPFAQCTADRHHTPSSLPLDSIRL